MAKLQDTIKKGKEFVLFERGKALDNRGFEDKNDKKDHKLNENRDESEIKENQENKKMTINSKNKEEKKDQKGREDKEVAKNKKEIKTAKHMKKLQDSIKKGKELVILEKSKLFKKKTKHTEEKKKLNKLAKMTEDRLLKISSVWPFDFFPNQIYIEEKQVIVVFKQFFFITQEYNILIQDILVPVVENSILFSTLKIQLGPGGFQQDPPPIKFLPKKDALMAKQIIMGLLVCHKEEIKLEDLEKEELIEKLIEIGSFKKD